MSYRFQAEIKAEHLRAMAHLAAQRDVRYYLLGVQVMATPEVLLAATDGNQVGLLHTRQLASARFQVRVPNDTLKAMGKARGPVVIGSDDGKAWTMKVGPATLAWVAESETYPDVQRAMPASVSGKACKFDVNLLALFRKVAKELDAEIGSHTVLLGQNGGDTALVSLPQAPDFIGALAPLRQSDEHPEPAMSAPYWAKEAPGIPANWAGQPAEEPCDLI